MKICYDKECLALYFIFDNKEELDVFLEMEPTLNDGLKIEFNVYYSKQFPNTIYQTFPGNFSPKYQEWYKNTVEYYLKTYLPVVLDKLPE